MLFDGLVPHIASVLDGLYLRRGRPGVSYAGVPTPAARAFQPMPCLFDQDRLVGHGVLVPVAVRARWPRSLAHGYPAPERSMTATATSTLGNQVIMIDWRPAFDAYQEIIRAQYGIALTRENFYQYAVHFPFGIVRANEGGGGAHSCRA